MAKILGRNRKKKLTKNGTQSFTKTSKNTFSHPMNETARLYMQRDMHRR